MAPQSHGDPWRLLHNSFLTAWLSPSRYCSLSSAQQLAMIELADGVFCTLFFYCLYLHLECLLRTNMLYFQHRKCLANGKPPTNMVLKQNELRRGAMGRFLVFFLGQVKLHVERIEIVVQISTVPQTQNTSHNFRFSSNHIGKSKMKLVKLILMMYFI